MMMASTYDDTMFRETFEQEFTYINGFLRNVHRFAGRTALSCPIRERAFSYAQLDVLCNQVAGALLGDGVGPQDIVMFQLLNSLEFALLYLAPKKLGAISCPINFRLSYGETAAIIDDSRPRVFFYDTSVRAVAEKALEIARHQPERIVVVDIHGKETQPKGRVLFDDYIASGVAAPPPVGHPSSIYSETTRLYTVGPAGEPRGVPLNNVVEVMSAHDVIMHFPLSPLDVTLNMTPWFHRGGLYSGGPNPALYLGAQVVPMHRFDAGLCLEYVGTYGITYLIGTPTNFEMLCDVQRRQPRDLTSLKGIVTMGAPLERDACLRFQQVLSPNVCNGYGTTEAFWNTFLRPFDLPAMAGSAGRACTDDDVAVVKMYPDRLAEPDDHVAKDSREVGEVIVRAPGKCCYTYINQPDAAKRTFYKGWIYIGDLGVWDEDEYVTIVARKDGMLISGGENIHPGQVEAALEEHPQVRRALVVGVPDEKWGELVTAYIEPADSVTAAELNAYCLRHPMLSRYKRPRYYRFIDSLPAASTDRQVRRMVREQAIRDLHAGLLKKPGMERAAD